MKYLLDTHALLWFMRETHYLPPAVLQTIEIAVSPMPFHHRDPFDRLLIAPAQVDRLTIITSDSKFPAYGVPLLW